MIYYCNYNDSYIVFKGTIKGTRSASRDGVNRLLIFETCAPFTSCISEKYSS